MALAEKGASAGVERGGGGNKATIRRDKLALVKATELQAVKASQELHAHMKVKFKAYMAPNGTDDWTELDLSEFR